MGEEEILSQLMKQNTDERIVKNLGTRDSTFATLYYQLSHAGIRKHNHVLTWFGDLSYRNLKIEYDDDFTQKCPYCFEKLVEVYSLGPYRDKPQTWTLN